MFIGSENQFRNLFVVSRNTDADLTQNGDIKLVTDATDKSFHFEFKDVNNIIHSDIIEPSKVLYANFTTSDLMNRQLKAVTIKPNGEIISGQDYIVHIQVQNYIGLGDDLIHTKFGAVHATKGMTAGKWCLYMALSLAKNFSREATKLFKFVVSDGGGTTAKTKEITADMTYAQMDAEFKTTSTYKEVVVYEVEQPWRRGISPVEPVNFTVIPSTILEDGEYKDCAEVGTIDTTTDKTPVGAIVGNGKNIADMEWFYHGNRGDAIRGWAYPNDFEFTPMVEANKTYDVIDIHYYQINSNMENGRSERTLTLVCDSANKTKAYDALKTTLTTTLGDSKIVVTK